jgi:hypothetical protein
MVKKKNPINAIKFTYEIIISKGLGKLTRKSENMLIMLAERAIRKKTYFYEEDRKDCLQTSYLNLFTNWQSFNPDKTTNAFAYFTEIHKRSTTEEINRLYMKKGLKKEEQKYVKTVSINSSNSGQGLYNV